MNGYRIEGMKCESCVAKISSALREAGFADAEVTRNPPLVRFVSRSATKDELQKIIEKAGDFRVAPTLEAPANSHHAPQAIAPDENLTPLFVILAYLLGGVLLRAFIAVDYSFASLMNNFMGGFFVVFSLFKLLNLSGFAEAYATYDIVASRSRAYAVSYPFIELLLGLAYFTGWAPLATNIVTLILMSVGSVGVLKALKSKRAFQCACLGTALKLPMTKVTLIEDVTMGLMALLMIIHQLQF
jgi:copper chaperone CopZ